MRIRARLKRTGIRVLAVGALLGCTAVGLLLGATRVEHRAPLELPAPTGPYGVGRTIREWMETGRPDALAPRPGVPRDLVVWIWYPTARTPSAAQAPPAVPAATPAAAPAPYLPAYWRAPLLRHQGVLLGRFFNREPSVIRAHSLAEAPVATNEPAFPIVMLRAGLGAPMSDYTTLAEDLASHGYVVVGFDAPYRTALVVYPDGRFIERPPALNPEGLPHAQQDRLIGRLLAMWCEDLGFVLDRLAWLNEHDPSGHFRGRLDLSHVGVVGHSLGGATAMEFCREDSRCTAAIDLDGAPQGRVIRTGLRQPLMFVLSDHGDLSRPVNARIIGEMRSIYERVPADRRVFLILRGTFHFSFTDQSLIKSQIVLGIVRHAGLIGPVGARRGLAMSADLVRSFLDVYLEGRPKTLLEQAERAYVEVDPREPWRAAAERGAMP